MNPEIEAIQKRITETSGFVEPFFERAGTVVIGQKNLLRSILMTILARGHILIEGLPGLAKTLAARTTAALIEGTYSRIQFTPDLLPSDITGTTIYNQNTGKFESRKGPIFANIVLADEINRAPAKVQSALLEAMQERQVTIGETSYPLPDPFLVLATENPIEQEGTYPLPEAQIDRFLFKIDVTYPSREEEEEILKRMSAAAPALPEPVITQEGLARAVEAYEGIYVDEKLYGYVARLLEATRTPGKAGLSDLEAMIQYGASPRSGIFLVRAAKANAFLNHRGYTTPEDVREVARTVLSHRIIPTYEAEAENISREEIILKILDTVEAP
ncbi:MAG: ATPase [Candidatus Hydrogenedentota bacterium]|nr:MAG: ATPase [Candidatus Hydrogenedentota bacterium]